MDPGSDFPPPFRGKSHLQDIPLTQSDRSRCFNQITYADELVENDEYFSLGIVLDTQYMNSPLLAIDSTRGTTDVRIIGNIGELHQYGTHCCSNPLLRHY